MADGAGGKGMGGVLFEAGQSAVKATANQVKQGAQTVAQDVTGSLFGKPLGANPKSTTAFPFPQKPPPGQFPKMPPKMPGGQLPKLDGLGGMFEKGMGGKSPFGPSLAEKKAEEERQKAELTRITQENQQRDQQAIAALTKKLHDEIYYNKIKNAGGSLEEEWAKKQKAEEDEREAKKAADAQRQAQQGPIAPGSFSPGKIENSIQGSGGVGNQQLVRTGAHEAVKSGQ